MNVAIGVGLLTATVLLLAWTFGQFRRPRPKAWTENETLTVALMVIMVGLFSFGLGFLSRFAADPAAETRWPLDIAVTAIALALCLFLIPRLTAPARQAPEPVAAPVPPEPANDPQPERPAGRDRLAGKGGKRRAA